jgi:hypothetical protein
VELRKKLSHAKRPGWGWKQIVEVRDDIAGTAADTESRPAELHASTIEAPARNIQDLKANMCGLGMPGSDGVAVSATPRGDPWMRKRTTTTAVRNDQIQIAPYCLRDE